MALQQCGTAAPGLSHIGNKQDKAAVYKTMTSSRPTGKEDSHLGLSR